ncbi:unnamed protein product, partial [Prorocentrum cordatum]
MPCAAVPACLLLTAGRGGRRGVCGLAAGECLAPAGGLDLLDTGSAVQDAGLFRERPLGPLRYRWAERLEEAEGVSYAARVTRGLYRGSFPDNEGVAWLRRLGVRTIINLNGHNSSGYRRVVLEQGIRYEHLPLSPMRAPTEEDVARFFEILGDWSASPIYVHCLHGVDRTGTMIALFRIREQGWRNDEALAEMIYFGNSGFKNLRLFV